MGGLIILDRLPISEQIRMVSTPDGPEEAKAFQIIVTVSVTDQDVVELPIDAPRFPAVLDTGNNHNFAMRYGQFERWVPTPLLQRGSVQIGSSTIPLLAANVWIHPNRPGTLDPSGQRPFLLALKEGIAVYPPDVPNPARLPILGLRAIIRNGLKLAIDGANRELMLESSSL